MSTRQIAVLVGSLRKESFSRKVAHNLIELAPKSLELAIVEIGDLPRSEKKSTRVFDYHY